MQFFIDLEVNGHGCSDRAGHVFFRPCSVNLAGKCGHDFLLVTKVKLLLLLVLDADLDT